MKNERDIEKESSEEEKEIRIKVKHRTERANILAEIDLRQSHACVRLVSIYWLFMCR
jgi:hypothetical protein